MHVGNVLRRSASARCRSPRPARRRRWCSRSWHRAAANSSIWRPTTRSVSPASRSARVSPTQMMAISPARCAASALARTRASFSPWLARRSEWPTMTSRRAGIAQHLRRDVARMGAGRVGMAVLPADLETAARGRFGRRHDQRRRQAERDLRAGRPCRVEAGVAHSVEFDERSPQAVHFPVAGHEGSRRKGHDRSMSPQGRCDLTEGPWSGKG